MVDLKTLNVIGTGSFGTVYDARDGNVIKVTSDPVTYELPKLIENPHVPIILEDYGKIDSCDEHNDELYAFKTPLLRPLVSRTRAHVKAKEFIHSATGALCKASWAHSNCWQVNRLGFETAAMQMLKAGFFSTQEFQAVNSIAELFEHNNANPDLQMNNFMQNSRGMLIFNDIVGDGEFIVNSH